jgi:hypothetical protein
VQSNPLLRRSLYRFHIAIIVLTAVVDRTQKTATRVGSTVNSELLNTVKPGAVKGAGEIRPLENRPRG